MAYDWLLIEVCDANLASVPELYKLEEKFSSISILENTCMSQCELCAQEPYVFFNGNIFSANNLSELLLNLENAIATATSQDTDT